MVTEHDGIVGALEAEAARVAEERNVEAAKVAEALALREKKVAEELASREDVIAERDDELARLEAMLADRDETIRKLRAAAMNAGGHMLVHLSHATGLRAADGLLSGGASDPYVNLTLAGKVEKSAVVQNNNNPRFDWDCQFSFASKEVALNELLQVEVWDQDTGSWAKDDKLGSGSLSLGEHKDALASGERVECVIKLIHKPFSKKQKADAGQVHLVLEWRPLLASELG